MPGFNLCHANCSWTGFHTCLLSLSFIDYLRCCNNWRFFKNTVLNRFCAILLHCICYSIYILLCNVHVVHESYLYHIYRHTPRSKRSEHTRVSHSRVMWVMPCMNTFDRSPRVNVDMHDSGCCARSTIVVLNGKKYTVQPNS